MIPEAALKPPWPALAGSALLGPQAPTLLTFELWQDSSLASYTPSTGAFGSAGPQVGISAS